MKDNYVLTVAGAKGGVGKTTTSTNLGACFAEEDYRTVVVEADIAMANVVDFVDLAPERGTAETLHDVLTGESTIVDAVYDVDDRFSVVPSGTDVDRYGDLEVERLAPALDHLRWLYDVIIFDTPAGMGEEVLRPLELADEVVLVSTPRVASIRNTHNTKSLVEDAGTEVRGLVLAKSGTGASPGADRIADFLDLDLLGHVPEDDAVPHSQDKGEPVVEYAPHSGAAIAYRRIASQLLDTPGSEGAGESRSGRAADRTSDGAGPSSTTGSDSGRTATAAERPGERARTDVAGSAGRRRPGTGADQSPRDRDRPAEDGMNVADGSVLASGREGGTDDQYTDRTTAPTDDGADGHDRGDGSRTATGADAADRTATSAKTGVPAERTDGFESGTCVSDGGDDTKEESRTGDATGDRAHDDSTSESDGAPDEGSDISDEAPDEGSDTSDEDASGRTPAQLLVRCVRSSLGRK